MNIIPSKDGTKIAFEKRGSGPPLILTDGAMCSRSFGPSGPLAELLKPYYTVYTYDRRGRGDSGDAPPYAMEREVEDLSALIDEAGGSVFLYGISSGAVLALEAAKRLPSIRKLALYEATLIVDDSRTPITSSYGDKLDELLGADRRGAAVKHFMRKGVLVPAPVVAMMPLMPVWKQLKKVAHTLVYDASLIAPYMRGKPPTAEQWASVSMPALIAYGSKSPVWIQNAMKALAPALPDAALRILEGQTHNVKPAALVPVLREFFADKI